MKGSTSSLQNNKYRHNGSRRIVIVGGSGFVGSHLVPLLISSGYEPIIIDIAKPRYDTHAQVIVCDTSKNWIEQLNESDISKIKKPLAYINLAGVSIGGRFTPERKKLIRDSRILTTRNMYDFFKDEMLCPGVLVQASAIGYYGDAQNSLLNESSGKGGGFLSDVVEAWEQETRRIEKQYNVRTAIFRQGHIIGNGGYVAQLLSVYKKGLGGPIGNGRQYLPWIHIDDLVEYYLESIKNHHIRGVYNMVAGEPITQKNFSQQLARVLKRPHFLKIPVWAMRMIYGELADEMVKSQRIIPQRIHDFEYALAFDDIAEAIEYSLP